MNLSDQAGMSGSVQLMDSATTVVAQECFAKTPPSGSDLAKSEIVTRAAHGAVALVVRQAIVYGSNILGGVVLARILPPAQFGFYGIVLFFLAFLNIFGGTGFAANLIRTPEQPSPHERNVVFTAQQIVVGCLVVGMWSVSPWLCSLYHMDGNGGFFRIIAMALLLTSLMVMPQVELERDLAFEKLAVVEVVQAAVFNLIAVFFAWRGYGELSFALALLARALCGVIVTYIICPLKIGLAWDLPVLWSHARFGVAFQASKLMSMTKDSVTPVFVGLLLGAAAVGYVTWANTLAAYAVLILIPFQRLYLPFFARLQEDRRELCKFVSHSLWAANAIAAPLTLLTLALVYPITSIVFGQKWVVAIPLYFCFSFGNLFSGCSAPMLGVLNALGDSKYTFCVNVMWMVSTWAFAVPLVHWFGIFGFGFAMIGVQLTTLVLYWLVWRELSLSPWACYWPSWPVAAAIAILLVLGQRIYPIRTLLALIMVGTAALAIYVAALWFGFPHRRNAILRLLRKPA